MTEETKGGGPAVKSEGGNTSGPPDRKGGPLKEAQASESREERLASALRANLKRRKAQSRSRGQSRKSDATGDGSKSS